VAPIDVGLLRHPPPRGRCRHRYRDRSPRPRRARRTVCRRRARCCRHGRWPRLRVFPNPNPKIHSHRGDAGAQRKQSAEGMETFAREPLLLGPTAFFISGWFPRAGSASPRLCGELRFSVQGSWRAHGTRGVPTLEGRAGEPVRGIGSGGRGYRVTRARRLAPPGRRPAGNRNRRVAGGSLRYVPAPSVAGATRIR